MKLFYILFSVIFSFNVHASAETKIPNSLNNGEFGSYIPKENFQILDLQIGRDTKLENIVLDLGESEVYEGEHTAKHICYSNQTDIIEFTQSSLGYHYRVLKISNYPRRCPILDRPFINDKRLKLGLSQSEVIQRLGKPSSTKDSNIEYTYWIQEKPSQEIIKMIKGKHNVDYEVWLDVYSGIQLIFDAGKLIQYSISTTETY